AEVAFDAEGEISHSISVELVAFVAVRIRVLSGKVKEIGIAECEWIALVGVGILVDGVCIFGLKQEVVIHMFAQTERYAAIEALRNTGGVSDLSEIGERTLAIGRSVTVRRYHCRAGYVRVEERGEINALGKSEISEGHEIRKNLLIVSDVVSVDSRVVVVLV